TAQVAGVPGDVLVEHLGRRPRDVVAEGLDERLVRQTDLLVAATVKNGRGVPGDADSELGRQPALADAGLTSEPHELYPLVVPRPLPGRGEQGPLSVAADEREVSAVAKHPRERHGFARRRASPWAGLRGHVAHCRCPFELG